MKNVIVLSCSTGQGHNSCAEAIKSYFEEKNINCEVSESLEFISPGFAKFISWGHNFIYRHIPWFFRWGYNFSERHPGVLNSGSAINMVLTAGAGRLYEHLAAGGYDTVICTHVFPSLALTAALRKYPLSVQTAFVDTDYTFSPGTEFSDLQWYFVPSDSLRGDFERRIAAPHRTVTTGIPVRGEFWTRHTRDEARRMLNIDVRAKHLLVMCGSMGCGPIMKLLRRVTDGAPRGIVVTAICGTNERLRRKLERRYAGDGRVHIVGYTGDVSLYMDSADLYITKPGGISVTEAAAKNLPMAFIDLVSGCEKYNMEFYTDLGAAITDTSVDRLAQRCVQLLTSGDELRKMRSALEDYRQPNGAELIYYELSKGTEQ